MERIVNVCPVPSATVSAKLPVKPLGRFDVLTLWTIPYSESASPTVDPERVLGVTVICGSTVPVTCPLPSTCTDLRKLKSIVIPLVVLLETTRAGLMVMVKFVAVRFVDTAKGLGGEVEVLMTVSCGLVSVICNWLYVPCVTLAVLLRILVKSVKRAKSTVAGAAEVINETACPPPCGTRLAEVIVATNDSTSHMGASVPKVTTDPVCAGVV